MFLFDQADPLPIITGVQACRTLLAILKHKSEIRIPSIWMYMLSNWCLISLRVDTPESVWSRYQDATCDFNSSGLAAQLLCLQLGEQRVLESRLLRRTCGSASIDHANMRLISLRVYAWDRSRPCIGVGESSFICWSQFAEKSCMQCCALSLFKKQIEHSRSLPFSIDFLLLSWHRSTYWHLRACWWRFDLLLCYASTIYWGRLADMLT